MGYLSTNDLEFQAKMARWIADRHEVLTLIRYSHAAGSKDFEFFENVEQFNARLRELPPRACVTVFGERQLPVRGRVDEQFIDQSLALIPDGTEFLIVGLERVKYGNCAWFAHTAGETSIELRQELQENFGELVAVGPYPPWCEDCETVASAVVPDPDGSVTTGVY